MTGLTVERLAVPFGPTAGLVDISFAAAPGECIAVVGASGSGKTSLLRAIAGLTPVRAGRVLVGGRDVTTVPAERREVVYLHQTPRLFPHLSVAENVAFPLRVRRADPAVLAREVGRALQVVRLEGLQDRAPQTLSGGQQQRVALARALTARPTVLLLDEPWAALDPALRDEVRQSVVELRGQETMALVIVTHDFDEASLLADRVGVLLDGTLAQLAPPAVLFNRPASVPVARFLGFPNIVHGEMEASGSFASPLGLLRPARPCRVGPAIAVARAEALSLGADAGPVATVERLLCRAQRTTAIVAVASLRLEIGVDAVSPPSLGSQVRLAIDPRQVSVFPSPA